MGGFFPLPTAPFFVHKSFHEIEAAGNVRKEKLLLECYDNDV